MVNLESGQDSGLSGYSEVFDLRKSIDESFAHLSKTKVENVHEIALSLHKLLNEYYLNALKQSKQSFFIALFVACLGFGFFILAVIMIVYVRSDLSYIPIISGALVELIAGTLLIMYNKSKEQLAEFFTKLEGLNRFIIANSICESLDNENKQKARLNLIDGLAKDIN